MPLWVGAIMGGLLEIAGSLVGRVLLSLGIGFVAYTGISAGVGAIQTLVQAKFSGLGADAVVIFGVMKLDVCSSILFSALIARLTMMGMTSGTVKRMVVK